MSRLTGTCVPNDEGDAIASLRPAEALVRLSHTRDRDLLARSVELLADALQARESVDARSLG